MCYLKALFIILLIPMHSYANEDFLSPVISSHEKIARLLEIKNPDQSSVFICYNYSCKTKRIIHINAENIASLNTIFKQLNTSGHGERHAIAQSIALLENIAATQSPVYNDKAKNYNDNHLPGSMDCIDSTVNTTHYLELLNQLGLIIHHELQQPVYRSPYLMGQHWAAQIKNKNSRQSYAVDSWQTDNGLPPVIQDIEKWKTREPVNN